MVDLSKPLEYPVLREVGSASSLEIVLRDVEAVALDARGFLSPLDILKHAAAGSRPGGTGELVGSAYNADSTKAAKETLRKVVADANSALSSLLCRQLFDRAIETERKREEEMEKQFKDMVLQVFSLADEDGSGRLEHSEVRSIARSSREAEVILSRLDKDNDGEISEDEWLAFFMELMKTNASLASVLLERTVHMIFERDFMNACRGLFHEFDQVRPPPARPCPLCASATFPPAPPQLVRFVHVLLPVAFALRHPPQDGSGQLELNEVLVMMGDDEEGMEFLRYADDDGSATLTLDEWMSFFLGFWRYHPRMARHNVGYLMGRAAELRSMPALPPTARAA